MSSKVGSIVTATDGYKLNHWSMYPPDTKGLYSYMECRSGSRYPETVFFGLQYVLKRWFTDRVTAEDVNLAASLSNSYFGRPDRFNRDGWDRIVKKHRGRLPLRIKAVPEGSVVPVGNVLMTIESTDPKCFWLTNYVESLLMHVWYPSTVATLSRSVKASIAARLHDTADSSVGLEYMLHDFGYRSASSHESAMIGGAAHLLNFLGTDTVPALEMYHYYGGCMGDVEGASIPATEHSIMTALGKEGEVDVVRQILRNYPDGAVSMVGDSYSIYKFVENVCTVHRDAIMDRDGTIVVRPDDTTIRHTTPEGLVVWILDELWTHYGGIYNRKGYRVLDPHVRVIWGDGLSESKINQIMDACEVARYSVENLVFGMGGGLLQDVRRDDQRFATKASSIKRRGAWSDIYKVTPNKSSKRGRLSLIEDRGEIVTVPELSDGCVDLLQTVYENGVLLQDWSFDEIKGRAAL